MLRIKEKTKVGRSNQKRGLEYKQLTTTTFKSITSDLKEKFLTLIEFDPYVQSYKHKPVDIEFFDNDETKVYTPDYLVTFKPTSSKLLLRPILVEIMYSKEINHKLSKFEQKLNAAKNYAEGKGWEFNVLTEKEIISPFLANAEFLKRYRTFEYDNLEDFELLIQTIKDLNHTSPLETILVSVSNEEKQIELLDLLWYMILKGYVHCDLNKPLNMESEIWI